MSQSDAQSAASSAAPTPTDVLGSLSETELSTWRTSGELPDRSSSSSADSTPAAPAGQAAETSASSDAPASEPGQPKKKNAESRKAELDTEIQTLLQKRHALRQEIDDAERRRGTPPRIDVPAASSPATGVPLAQIVDAPDATRPFLSDAEFFTAYPEATLGDYGLYTARYALTADRVRQSVQSARQDRLGRFGEQFVHAAEADPTFKTSLSPRVLALTPTDLLQSGVAPTASNDIAQAIITSPAATALLRHFSAHPDDLDRLEQLPSESARAREMGRLEARMETPVAAPVVKTTSSAPPPPTTLGSKTQTPTDDAESAIAAGDVARYFEIMNRREVAAR
jgi:hypothetical protein